MDNAERESTLCELLPWHVNGTLDAQETAAMCEHLTQCDQCRRDFPMLRDTAAAIENDTVVALPRRGAYAAQVLPNGRRQRSGHRRAMALAAGLVLALAASVLWVQRDSSEASYRTVTGPGAMASTDYVVAVELKPGTGRDESAALFARLGALSVAAPLSGSSYRVVLRTPSASLRELRALEARLESYDEVARARVVGIELPAEVP